MNINGINPISPISPIESISKKPLIQTDSNSSFSNILSDAMKSVNEADKANNSETMGLLTGQSSDLHTSMIEAEKADMSFQFAMQVRNKVLDAYNEMMRMQV